MHIFVLFSKTIKLMSLHYYLFNRTYNGQEFVTEKLFIRWAYANPLLCVCLYDDKKKVNFYRYIKIFGCIDDIFICARAQAHQIVRLIKLFSNFPSVLN